MEKIPTGLRLRASRLPLGGFGFGGSELKPFQGRRVKS